MHALLSRVPFALAGLSCLTKDGRTKSTDDEFGGGGGLKDAENLS